MNDTEYYRYYRKHEVCPKCNGRNYAQTCIGYIMIGEGFKDTNRVNCECGFVGIMDDLVPAADPWIKCSERLPEFHKRVILYDPSCSVCSGSFFRSDYCEGDDERPIKPTHWQPLPEPPRE